MTKTDCSKEIAEGLEGFIRESFQVPDDDTLFSREVNLWEEGYVDSPGVIEVIAFLEDTYRVKIPQETLFLPEFTTIRGMSEAVSDLPSRD
jgi:acyl carrier protein